MNSVGKADGHLLELSTNCTRIAGDQPMHTSVSSKPKIHRMQQAGIE
jgi:hypothetical protein